MIEFTEYLRLFLCVVHLLFYQALMLMLAFCALVNFLISPIVGHFSSKMFLPDANLVYVAKASATYLANYLALAIVKDSQ